MKGYINYFIDNSYIEIIIIYVFIYFVLQSFAVCLFVLSVYLCLYLYLSIYLLHTLSFSLYLSIVLFISSSLTRFSLSLHYPLYLFLSLSRFSLSLNYRLYLFLSPSILSSSHFSSLPSLFLDSLDLSIPLYLFLSLSLSILFLSFIFFTSSSSLSQSPLCLFLYPSTFLCPTPTRQTPLCYPNKLTHSKPQRPDRPIAPQQSEPNISLCHPPNILHPLGRLLACSTFYYHHRTTPSLLIPLFSHPRPFSPSLHPHVCTSSNFSLNTYASVQVLRSTCCFKAATRSVEIVNLREKNKTKTKQNKPRFQMLGSIFFLFFFLFWLAPTMLSNALK